MLTSRGRGCNTAARRSSSQSSSSSSSSLPLVVLARASMAAAASGGDGAHRTVRLAVVGDVHGDWDEDRDRAALQALSPPADAVLFVGDFGEERVAMVSGLVGAAAERAARAAAGAPPLPPRVVMLGNHDARYALTARGRKHAAVARAFAAAGLAPPGGFGGGGGGGGGDARARDRPQQRELRRAVESAAALASEQEEEVRAAMGFRGPGGEDDDPETLGPGVWAQLRALGATHAGFAHWGGLPLAPPPSTAGRAAAATAGRAAAAGTTRAAAAAAAAGGATTAVATTTATASAAPRPPPPLVSVVGARPFSKGGASFAETERFYRAFYGVGSALESAAKVARAARQAPAGRSLVVLAHNGPSGMGARRHDPCGVDWVKTAAGDHGDVDLRMALDALHEGRAAAGAAAGQSGKGGGGHDNCDGEGGGDDDGRRHVALVLHGHMHHMLRGGQHKRRMVHVDAERRTVVLNAATVPRVRSAPADNGGGMGGAECGDNCRRTLPLLPAAATLRHFLVVELREALDGLGSAEVESAEDVWVRVDEGKSAAGGDQGGQPRRRRAAAVAQRQEVLRTTRGEGGGGGVLKLAWDASAGHWNYHVWRAAPPGQGRGEVADELDLGF